VLRGEAEAGRALLAAVSESVADLADREPADRRWRFLAAWTRIDLAAALAEVGRVDAARSDAARAVAGLEELLEQEAGDRDALPWLARALILLGRIEDLGGRPAEAVSAWERAHRLLAPTVRSSRDPEILSPWASVLVLLGRREEAQPVLAALEASGYLHPELLGLRRAAGMQTVGARKRTRVGGDDGPH
jgi:tetratricopeptide (TPR) repeat protein